MSGDLEAKKASLKEDLERLKTEFKIELPKRISEARAYGDLKENAEYHAARERQSFVQARIAQLTEQLAQLTSLDVSNIPNDRIGFGSKVTVYDPDEEETSQFIFVSSNEVNPSEGKISLSSPIGAALNNKTTGEEVEIKIPSGIRVYKIQRIETIHGNVVE